jgi:hypothetical protein
MLFFLSANYLLPRPGLGQVDYLGYLAGRGVVAWAERAVFVPFLLFY